jgi:hypothetical protein
VRYSCVCIRADPGCKAELAPRAEDLRAIFGGLQPITLAIAEQEQVPAQRVTQQTIADEPVQSLEPLAHIDDFRGQIDRRRWTQSKHGLRPLEDSQQAFESTRIKIRMYLDPAPARQHHGQPTTRFLLRQQFPGVQLPGTNRPAEEVGLRLLFQRSFFRWRSRVPKRKPRLWQNSLRRMPLLTNSATNAEPPLAYVAWALTTLFLGSFEHFNTDPACRRGGLVRRLR